MQTVKTAVSIDKALFARANALARGMKISRSRLFALALEEYLRRRENLKALEEIDLVYASAQEPREKETLRKMRKTARRLAEGQW